MDYRWETLEDLHKQIKSNPGQFTPWLKIYLEQHAKKIFASYAG
jgi:isopentenyl-diphosphate delta-isomerase